MEVIINRASKGVEGETFRLVKDNSNPTSRYMVYSERRDAFENAYWELTDSYCERTMIYDIIKTLKGR